MRRRHRWAWIAGLLLLAALAFAAALPRLAAGWIEQALRAGLAARGIDAVAVGAIDVGLGETIVEDLVLGDAELVAPRIRVTYAPGDLLRGRVALLALEHVRAQVQLGDDAAGAFERLAEGALSDGDGSGGPPVRGVEIADLRVALRIPETEITVAIDGALRPEAVDGGAGLSGALRARVASSPDRVRGSATLALEPGNAVLDLALEGGAIGIAGIAVESFALSAHADGRADGSLALDAAAETPLGPAALSLPARIEIDTAARKVALRAPSAPDGAAPPRSRLRLPAQELALEGLTGEVALGEEPARVHVQVARIRDLRDAPRIPALALDATWLPQEEPLRVRGTATGAHDVALRFDASHDRTAGEGRAELVLAPLTFAPEGPQPRDLFPLLDVLGATGGRLAAQGTLSWSDGALRSDLELALDDLAGVVAGTAFEGLDATARLTRPWPPATPPGQSLEVDRIDLGVEIRELLMRFALQPPGVLDVASAHARVLGGTLRTFGRYDRALARNAFLLDVSEVDLGALAESLRLDGLTIRGSVSGRIPLALHDGAVTIEHGTLEATGGGVLQYRPEGEAPLPTDDTRVQLLLDALRDFRYEQLRITLDGALSGDLDIGVHLFGSSPDFYDGKPVEFNLDLEAPIWALLRDLDVEALPERVLRGLRQRQTPTSDGGSR